MKDKNKIKKIIDDVKSVGVNFLPIVPELLSPEIITDPKTIICNVLRGFAVSFLSRFKQEYNDKKEKEEIKKDGFYTEKPALTLVELMKIIDEGNLEEEKFKAIKSIFFSSVSKNSTKDDEIWAYEFLQTAKKLSSMEILILKANFEIAQGQFSFDVSDDVLRNAKSKRPAWKMIIANQMGYGELHAIVTKYETNLESLGLISPRCPDARFSDDFEHTQKYRLTEMGYKFCEFMTKYE